ncbi:MAG TPA: DUF4097 family beta strand repeat-containing protein [Pyrinomonadaceae bacterium]|jgi:hypothetical protein
MAERCNSCGAELFTGQQFCRACGTPTRQFSSEELPTQMLPPSGQEPEQQQRPTAQTPLATSPLPGRDPSTQGFGADYARYQPPPVPPQRMTAPVLAPPARRRSHRWIYAVVGLLLFFVGASVVAALFVMNRQAHRITRTVVRPNVKVPMPPVPPPHPMEAGVEGLEMVDGQSVFTKTYPLAKDGSFSLRNFSGDITVEGWDEQQAEVKIIRRGGSKEDARAPLQVMNEEGANRLVLNSMPNKSGGGAGEMKYVLKIPRNLRELEIVSVNSNVDLSNVHSASISINVQRGNIELEDVSGTVNSRTTKGNTTVVLSESAKGAPQIFNGVNGNIELELPPGTNAELKAETLDGNIDIDEDLGINVETGMVGRHAVGRIGKGGQPILVKVISGNIKIKS